MRRLLCTLLLLPFLVAAQTNESLVFENVMLTVKPEKITEFEAGLAAHNKKFHGDGPYGARVYNILNGKNAGKYMLSMGPLPWSVMDERPSSKEHTEDNNNHVNKYLTAEVDVNYMKMRPDLSNFTNDFEINKLSVFMIDIKRFKEKEFMEKVVKKAIKVYKEKMPEQQFGIYTNQLPNADGMDFGWVDFFENSSWLGKDDKFPQYFDEVHGEGSFVKFLADAEATTNGESTEIWQVRKDLSGIDAKVVALTRN